MSGDFSIREITTRIFNLGRSFEEEGARLSARLTGKSGHVRTPSIQGSSSEYKKGPDGKELPATSRNPDFAQVQETVKQPDVRYVTCPRSTCGKGGALRTDARRGGAWIGITTPLKVYCERCEKSFCRECRVRWHEDRTCKAYQEAMLYSKEPAASPSVVLRGSADAETNERAKDRRVRIVSPLASTVSVASSERTEEWLSSIGSDRGESKSVDTRSVDNKPVENKVGRDRESERSSERSSRGSRNLPLPSSPLRSVVEAAVLERPASPLTKHEWEERCEKNRAGCVRCRRDSGGHLIECRSCEEGQCWDCEAKWGEIKHEGPAHHGKKCRFLDNWYVVKTV